MCTSCVNRNRAGAQKRTSLLAVLFGVGLVLLGGVSIVSVVEHRHVAVETTGTLTAVDGDPDRPRVQGGSPSFSASYTYEYEGERYRSSGVYPGYGLLDGMRHQEVERLLRAYESREGGRVTVYVDPSNPERSYVEDSSRNGFAWWAVGAGLSVIGTGVGRYVQMRRWLRRNAEDDE